MVPEASLLDRFRADIDALIEAGVRFGVAVSGGPDSLGLLLLAAAVRPGELEAATVDHGLREESHAEAEAVARICERLGVPHSVLAIEWDLPPTTAIQELARQVRYGALAGWMRDRNLPALMTAHQLDDQAETLLMRLNRGSGARGLAGMRRSSTVPGDPELKLLRPLLGWRRSELEEICHEAGLTPAIDPSNADERHERVRIRRVLADNDWIDAKALARSADNLASSDEALAWAADREWAEFVEILDDKLVYRASTAPVEIIRRVAARAIAELGTEGSPNDLRGRELDRLISNLQACRVTTLRGVRCSGGADWTFVRAPTRSNGKS
jgi:tRNA(Ile)-lysidine synthase